MSIFAWMVQVIALVIRRVVSRPAIVRCCWDTLLFPFSRFSGSGFAWDLRCGDDADLFLGLLAARCPAAGGCFARVRLRRAAEPAPANMRPIRIPMTIRNASSFLLLRGYEYVRAERTEIRSFGLGGDADIVTQIAFRRIQKIPRLPFIWLSHRELLLIFACSGPVTATAIRGRKRPIHA
jgi:hypothetical protein